MSLLGTLPKVDGEAGLDWKKFLDKASAHASESFQTRKKSILAGPSPKDEGQQKVHKQLEAQADQRPQLFQLDVKPVQR